MWIVESRAPSGAVGTRIGTSDPVDARRWMGELLGAPTASSGLTVTLYWEDASAARVEMVGRLERC